MCEPCTLTIRRTESGYVFVVSGRGTLRSSPTVQKFIREAIDNGSDVVLDLSDCEYLDSTFLGCLLILHQHGTRSAGSFAVHAGEAAQQKLLSGARLHKVLSLADQCPECIGDAVTLDISEVDRSEFGQHVLEAHQQLAALGGPAAAKFRAVADQLAKELADGS